jgi:hypothetical protein
MTRIEENLWPAQQPSPGFADAAVERMLAAQPLPTKPPGQRRWVVLATAAIFASGAAYGWGLRNRVASPPPEPVEVLAHIEATSTTPQRVPRIRLPLVPDLAQRACVRSSLRTNAPSAATLPVQAASPSSPKIPACQCERGFSDVICDCY